MAGRLLVIAPDSDLRKSLVFALNAHGFSVTSRDGLRAVESDGVHYDCAVIDEKALPLGAALASLGIPFVLLANALPPEIALLAAGVVGKPPRGEELILTVNRAIGQEATTK